MNTIFSGLRRVFEQKRYIALAGVLALLGGFLLHAATALPGQSLESWLFSTPWHVKFLVVFGALMVGLIGSVQAFTWLRMRRIQKRNTAATLGALLSTALAGACCSPLLLPLVSLAGFAGVLFFLQTHQVAVVTFSSVFLIAALHYSCKAAECKECLVSPKGKK